MPLTLKKPIQSILNHQEVLKHSHSIPMRGGGQNNSYLDSFPPFSFFKLLFSLYTIQQNHKKQQRFYKQTIQVFPSLKYPKLESCKDYKESLSFSYHLAYLLGEVLSKASKFWYKGGYLKLIQEIKQRNPKVVISRISSS